MSDIIDGNIAIWKAGLQHLGLINDYKQRVLEGVAEIGSETAKTAVESKGFEYLHEHLSIPQLLQLDRLLIRRFAPEARNFFARFLNATGSAQEATYYFAEQAWVRIMAPENRLTAHLPLIKDELGHMVPHNPHRDSWFSQASNVINFWIALGRVRPGNSVLIYPESYAEDLETEDLKLSTSQRLAPPINFTMDEGDILFFHGDHLHSSEINITNESRVVLSFRLTYERPEYAHSGNRFEYKLL